ncbi:Hint domain-containing protein [Labrys neptuniae]|uniref:Hint domain-containing protein n=1 Tax=Labrys neptuniae TaxID=376174 RepID=UPI0028910CD1|nr:Hint domain-containing protein [Labrys neptuniae]MDT3375923.1 Hint domain-containing protein [Labrys neptuniae]
MPIFGPNAGGVSYDITQGAFTSTVNISGGQNGTTNLTGVPNGNIATTNGTTLNLVSLLGTSNYAVAPGVTANVVLVANALGTSNVYIGGTATLSTAVSLLSNTNINVTGGSATLANGLNVSALNGTNVTLTDGGSFTNGNNLSSILDGMTINYGPGGGTFTVNGGNTLIDLSSTTINGFATNNGLNHLEFTNTSGTAATYTVTNSGGNQVITVLDSSNGTIATVTIAGQTLNAGTYTVGQNGPLTVGSSGTTLTITDQAIVCFLAGSLIRTAVGEVAIENIQVGDEVFVSIDGKDELRPVTWIGSGHVLSNPVYPMDMGGYPVRILKDAIAEGVPYQDLLVTAEHSFFFEGKLVPIRMLVNGRSIFYDRSFQTYTYYHVELAQHGIIHANGMLSESYLDTGNRKNFVAQHGVVPFPGKAKDWSVDAAAPLCVERAFVEPIFRAIEARAALRNDPVQSQPVELTREADLHLVTESGRVIRQAREADGMALFMIPSNVRSVRIVSRASRPADTIGPYVDDRRFLGVLVGAVTLQDGNVRREIDTHLTTRTLRGWSVPEGSRRWTDGDAVLPLGERAPNAIAMLGLQIVAAGPYVVEADAAADAALNG